VFWKFLGLGGTNEVIREKLDTFSDKAGGQYALFPIVNYERISDEELYDMLRRNSANGWTLAEESTFCISPILLINLH
jgi:hypothetical protein